MAVGTGVIPHRVWNEGAARPVLALHCSLAHAGAWAGLAGQLADRRLIAPDQAGHGRQAPWDGRSDLFGQTLEEAAVLAPDQFDLIGHSFGAVVALGLARRMPERVRSLTLIEPPFFAAARAAGDARFALFHARHRRFEDLVHRGETRAALALFHGDWGNGVVLEDLPERVVADMEARIHLIVAQRAVLLQDREALLAPGGLEGLRLPVTLVEGDQSPPIVAAIQAALGARIAGARREVVRGAGHMLAITHPAELAGILRAHAGF